MSERDAPDITERLRNPGWNGYVYDSDREDGAAEIDRLRARCAELEKALDREDPTEAEVHDACMSYSHDYGIMDEEKRRSLQAVCRSWWVAITRARAASIRSMDV